MVNDDDLVLNLRAWIPGDPEDYAMKLMQQAAGEIEQLRATVASLIAALKDDWRPIDTAPPDVEILMVNEHNWQRIDYLPERAGDRPFASDHWSDTTGKECYPTHWKPKSLPPRR